MRMTEDELRKYNAAQIDEILRYKWIESEKQGHDIGELKAACEWITKYGAEFNKHYYSKN
jgi:hypothetical protein